MPSDLLLRVFEFELDLLVPPSWNMTYKSVAVPDSTHPECSGRDEKGTGTVTCDVTFKMASHEWFFICRASLICRNSDYTCVQVSRQVSKMALRNPIFTLKV